MTRDSLYRRLGLMLSGVGVLLAAASPSTAHRLTVIIAALVFFWGGAALWVKNRRKQP